MNQTNANKAANPAFKEAFKQLKDELMRLHTKQEDGKSDIGSVNSEMRDAYRKMCRLCLANQSYERALEESRAALAIVEDEEIRVINFLCLFYLKFFVLAEKALNEGLKQYPHNKIFKQYQFKIPSESEQNLGSSIIEEVGTGQQPPTPSLNTQPTPPLNMPRFPNTGMPMPNMQNLSMFENMRDEDLSSMMGMMKNPMMKQQMRSMYGRDISDQEMARMEQMMTPQNLKMALNMMKSNPDLLNQVGARLPANPGFPAPPQMPAQLPTFPTTPAQMPQPNNRNVEAPLPDLTQGGFPGGMPPFSPQGMPPFGAQGMPNMPNADMLMENKSQIKMALGMFKENPKQILSMLSGMMNNPQLNSISQMSERKLKVIANILYYLVITAIEVFAFVRKYKAQLLVLAIAAFVYYFLL